MPRKFKIQGCSRKSSKRSEPKSVKKKKTEIKIIEEETILTKTALERIQGSTGTITNKNLIAIEKERTTLGPAATR